MKQIYDSAAILFLWLAIGFTRSNAPAQTQPVFLRLKGVGVGSPFSGSNFQRREFVFSAVTFVGI